MPGGFQKTLRHQKGKGRDMLRGGYTCYGQDIGIMMLDTSFPRMKGDIGNALTFPFPVRYKIVRNVFQGASLPRDADAVLLNAFREAAKELEADGCKAITTSCGFLAGFQKELAEAVHIPVFTSTLALIPMIYPMLGKNQTIAVFTEKKEFMTESLFNKNGWSAKNIPVTVWGMDENSAFNDLIIRNSSEGDLDRIRKEVEQISVRFHETEKNCGAIVLECQNLSPFGKTIQDITGLPVFGMNQRITFMRNAVSYPDYN